MKIFEKRLVPLLGCRKKLENMKTKQCKITNTEAKLGYVRTRQLEIVAVLDSKEMHRKEKFF